MKSHLDIFLKIAGEVQIVDSSSFSHPLVGTLSPETERDPSRPLLKFLARFIYLAYHAGDYVAVRALSRKGLGVSALPDYEDFDFAESLSLAHAGSGYVDWGWTMDEGASLVSKNGVTLRIGSRDLVSEGTRVGVRLPPERRYAMPGWYLFIGDAGPSDVSGELVRVYFTLQDAAGARELVHVVTRLLNKAWVPFQFKVVNHPASWSRRDAGVLYLERGVWMAHNGFVGDLQADLASHLRDDCPPMALRLGHGLAFAEDPSLAESSMSFGQHRSRLVAEGLLDAFDSGAEEAKDRFDAMANRFRREGLDIARPYLSRLQTG